MSNAVIQISNFQKSFGTKKVIKDMSFDVSEGEIFAFLGANGSGKTTTIRCLLNIYTPDAGELKIFGKQYSPEMASSLGYLPEERGLYINSKVLETLVYFGELKGMSKADATKSAKEYLELVELADKEKVEIKKLSSGQQQKIQLGVTVINKPKLLILDEPTKGLDPVNRQTLLKILMKLNSEGSTIVFSTHQMEEAERIANRLLMIKNGNVELYGTVADVKKRYISEEIFVRVEGELIPNNELFEYEKSGNIYIIKPKKSILRTAVVSFVANNNNILELKPSEKSLNDIFIEISKD